MARWLFLPLFVAAALAQTASAIRREGPDWVQTTTGAVQAPFEGRLKLDSLGAVVLRGESASQVRYTLRKRVRVDSEAEARRILGQTTLKARTTGDLTEIAVSSAARRQSTLDLELTAPRGIREIRARTDSGDLEAYDFDGSVEMETGGGRLKADRIGMGLVARSGGGAVWLGVVRGSVRSSTSGGSIYLQRAGGEAYIETGGGEVFVQEVWGPLQVTTGGGNIVVRRASAAVIARTAAGVIEVGEAGGLVTAQTYGGAIEIGSARGVRCEAQSGAIRLRSITGALHANTAAGSIIAEFAAGRPLDSMLSTGTGDITVFIPSNVAVTVKAQNESGGRAVRIVSDFPEIRVQPGALNAAVAEGAINGGGPLLRVATSNGSIFIRRR